MNKSQSILSKQIKKKLIDKDLKQKDLIPYLKNRKPGINIQEPHVSMAIAGRYPTLLKEIMIVLNEI